VQALLVFLAIAALSLLASSRTLLDPSRLPGVAQLAASGLIFLIFGALLGPGLAGVLTLEDLQGLRPVVALGLGTAGVILGLNMDPRLLRRLPRPVFSAALAHGGVAFLFVTVPLAAVLVFAARLPLRVAVGGAALLGAAASMSSGHYAVLGYRSGRMERSRGLAVALLTMLDDGVGLVVLALALVLGAAANPADGAGLVCLAILLGLLCGALVAFLTYSLKDPAELMAVMLGGVALVGGAAAYLRVSALLAGVACGATLALVGGRAVEQVAKALGRFERPTYLILVFLAGCHLQARDINAWLLLPGYVALRFVGKVWGGSLAQRIAASALKLPPRLGYALIAQGGLALCLVIQYRVLVPGTLAQHVFDVVALGAVINEVLAIRAFRLVLESPRTPTGEAS
jgi:hypothetical protein